VLRAERCQVTGQGQPLNQRARRLPGGSCSCHRQQFTLKRPPVVIESPCAIADIDMADHRLPGLLEPDWREPRRRVPLQERPRQDVARARSKERLIATPPRQQLISPLRGGPPVTRRRYVSHENYITTPDRQLTQLVRSRSLDGVAGIALGSFHGFAGLKDRGWTILDVLHDRLGGLGVPVLGGLFCGHDLAGADGRPDQSAIAIGAMAVLDADRGRLTLEPCVQ
jgi:LD-carboxypeptidase C-terminal domain